MTNTVDKLSSVFGALILALLFLLPGRLTAAEPEPPAPVSALYRLRVDGREIVVRDESRFGFHTAAFTVAGPAEVEIALPASTEPPVVRPLRHKLRPVFRDSEARFTLPGPLNLVVQAKGLPPLALFATPAETELPRADGPDVLYFGPGVHEPGVIRPRSGQRFIWRKARG